MRREKIDIGFESEAFPFEAIPIEIAARSIPRECQGIASEAALEWIFVSAEEMSRETEVLRRLAFLVLSCDALKTPVE